MTSPKPTFVVLYRRTARRPPFRSFDEMLWIARFKELRGQGTGTLVLRNIRAVIPFEARMIYRDGYQKRQHQRAFWVLRRIASVRYRAIQRVRRLPINEDGYGTMDEDLVGFTAEDQGRDASSSM